MRAEPGSRWKRAGCQHPTDGGVLSRQPAGLTPFPAVRRGVSIRLMEQAKPREAADRARRRLVSTLLVTGGALFVAAIVLATLNHTFTDDPFTLLSIAFLVTYAGSAAVLASRVPQNPIGWLFLVAGLGVLLGRSVDGIRQVRAGNRAGLAAVRGRRSPG